MTMEVLRYQFADGARFQAGAKADPNSVGSSLETLRQQFKGELTPSDIVEAARSTNHPLHSFFEWDDTKAAQAHRLAQARTLIRSVVAVYRRDKTSAPIAIKAFMHIPEGETSHYRSTPDALSQKKTRDAVLQMAWRELAAWRKKYRDLKQFADLVKVIDEVEDKLPATVTKVH